MAADQCEEVTVEGAPDVDRHAAAPRDADDFAVWVSPHVGVLAGLAAREVGSSDADDVVQEALLRAWRRRETFRPERGCARAWLAAIVLDQAHRYRMRVLRTRTLRLGTGPEPADAVENRSADEVDLDRAIAHLPRRQRQVITLHYLVGLSVDSVAAALGIAPGSVKSQLHDARAALRERLERP